MNDVLPMMMKKRMTFAIHPTQHNFVLGVTTLQIFTYLQVKGIAMAAARRRCQSNNQMVHLKLSPEQSRLQPEKVWSSFSSGR